MSLKRSHTSSKSSFGGDAGAKVDRQELFDELKRMAGSNEAFSPVDVSLAIGAGEPQVSKALLGLAAEGYLELGLPVDANDELESITPGARHLPEVLGVRAQICVKAKKWFPVSADASA